jgi:hypothetical protein
MIYLFIYLFNYLLVSLHANGGRRRCLLIDECRFRARKAHFQIQKRKSLQYFFYGICNCHVSDDLLGLRGPIPTSMHSCRNWLYIPSSDQLPDDDYV